MPSERLTEHFWLDELLVSSTADQLGIANTPTPTHLERLRHTLAPGLERVRTVCGDRPMTVTSAYRNPEINRLVGGTASSAHPMGFAADIRISGLSAWTTARAIATAMAAGTIGLDQLILESGRSIVHVSFAPSPRMMRGHQPGPAGTAIDWHFFD